VPKILYIDMDNTLVDFPAGLAKVDPTILSQYVGNEDEIPGAFALMPPLPGAVDAFHELAALFDVYILSTAPWKNPSAWRHKVEWVHEHLGVDHGTPAYKRLILSHHKHLNRGEFLVDDRPTHNGADKFDGEVIPFGHGGFEDWPRVVQYLREHA
jgi:5'-nucleotidase